MADTPSTNPPQPTATPSVPQAPSAPPSGGAPSATTTEPLQDWQSRYSTLESEYKPWQRLKEYGSPDEIAEHAKWSRQVQQALRAGKALRLRQDGMLEAYDPTPAPTSTPSVASDPYANWDDLTPKEQAALQERLIQENVSRILESRFKPEVDKVRDAITTYQQSQQSQNQLFMRAMQMQAQNPGVPFDELMAEATRMASLTPAELLDEALKAKLTPGQQKRMLEEAKQQWLAEQEAERSKRDVDALATSPGRLFRRLEGTPQERRQKNRLELLTNIRKEIGKSRASGE